MFFKELLAGVNISKITGNSTTCVQLKKDGQCLKKHENSVVISDLTMDKLYGIVICSVMDHKNLSFPPLLFSHQGISPRAEQIFISSESKFNYKIIVDSHFYEKNFKF